jgi:hypothetical protein
MTDPVNEERPAPKLGERRPPQEFELKDTKRLEISGELLIESSQLIELLHSYQAAHHIDYRFEFPTFLYSEVILPELVGFDTPDNISIIAGSARSETDEGEQKVYTYLSVELSKGLVTHRIERSNDIGNENADFIVSRSEYSNENTTEEMRPGEYLPVSRLSESDFNSLLISLASIGKTEVAKLSEKQRKKLLDTDLFDPKTFGFLVETLRQKSIAGTVTKGSYVFENDDTEINFSRDDEDISYTVLYTDEETGETMSAEADTTSGVTLKFYVYAGTLSIEVRPSTEQVSFFRRLIKDEIKHIKTINNYALSTNLLEVNPEEIALDKVEVENNVSLQRLRREVEWALGEDGFDSPDSGAR